MRIVERMARAMEYEPWYERDIFWCPELGACAGRVGWRSGSDAHGVRRIKTAISLLTAGELVRHDSAPKEWSEGDEIEASGDGALEIAQAYMRTGERAFDLETGVAGFLMDRRRKACLLFNDPYGVERLFICREGSTTLFSSEAKAILAVTSHTRMFDPEGLAEFLASGCTVGRRSLFRNVEILEGGTLVKLPAGGPVGRRSYFHHAGLDHVDPVDSAHFVDGLAERLGAAVSDAVQRPPEAGISLTGGLDSRMIMACLDARSGRGALLYVRQHVPGDA